MSGRAVELGLWTLLAAGIAVAHLGDAPRPARGDGAMTASTHRLRARTILQPWAHLIVHGAKRVENRTWAPSVRGLVVGEYFALHAGMRIDLAHWSCAYKTMPTTEAAPLRTLLERVVHTTPEREARAIAGASMPLGAVVGVARLVDDPYWFGPWGWRRDEVTAIGPVACKGALGVWTLRGEARTVVRSRWVAARRKVSHG
jgi:hypothetical protein